MVVYLGQETQAGSIVSICLSLVSMGCLSVCLSRRVENIRNWRRLPPVCWLVIIIYVDSSIFVAGTAILANGFGVDSSRSMCEKAILLCLGCYLTTKLIYYFLVERVYIVRRSSKPRRRDLLYLINSLGMLVPYCVVIVLNFYFRFAVYENGTCRIGMTRGAAIPLLTFDFVVNIYMTCLFLLPLRGLLSYKIDTGSPARTVAQRTFIGSLGTLISSIVNLTVMVVLNGEPGWICLMCCNIDILFSVLVLHWITSKDNASTMSTSHPSFSAPATRGQPPSSCPPRSRTPHPDINSYDMGLEYMAKGGVTTLVTASHDLDDDDIEKISGMPMANNVIKVQCEHTREVVDLNDSRGLESSGSGSMDDWCNKCEDDRV